MTTTRRGFLGRFLALIGLGSAVHAQKASSHPDFPDKKRLQKCQEAAVRAWHDLGWGARRPNAYQDKKDFINDVVKHLYETGLCYLWTTPNARGEIFELHVLPTHAVFPCAPTSAYPMGSFLVDPSFHEARPCYVFSFPVDGPWPSDQEIQVIRESFRRTCESSVASDRIFIIPPGCDLRPLAGTMISIDSRWIYRVVVDDSIYGKSPLEAMHRHMETMEDMNRARFLVFQNATRPGAND